MRAAATSILAIVLCSGCHPGEKDSGDMEPITRTEVKTTHPFLRELSDYIVLNGTTEYQRKSTVRATITGYIKSLSILPGDRIGEHRVLCYLATREQQALQGIDTTGLTGLNHPVAVLSSAGGIVSSVNFRSGDFVNESDVLATIAEPSSLIIQLMVPFEYRSTAHAGVSGEVVLPDGTKSSVRIFQELPSVDVASQAQGMLLRTEGNLSLPESMNVVVRIPRQTKRNAFCVPKSAVQSDETQTKFWIMKVVHDSVAIRVDVQPGITMDSIREITSPQVSIQDTIVTEGSYGLEDSARVIINE